MKNFISTFFMSLVICVVGAFLFAGLLVNNLWASIFAIAFVLSVLITAFINLESRLLELEKKIEKLSENDDII